MTKTILNDVETIEIVSLVVANVQIFSPSKSTHFREASAHWSATQPHDNWPCFRIGFMRKIENLILYDLET